MKLILFLMLFSLPIMAEDWTICGKTYENVIVGQIEPDCVHITYSNGIGRIAITDMPPELQARFKFDPAAAKAASDAKAKAFANAVASLPTQPKSIEIEPSVTAQPPSRPAVDAAFIQSQIASLQADIDQKTEIENREKATHRDYSGSGFRDVIASEQAQIAALKAQLR